MLKIVSSQENSQPMTMNPKTEALSNGTSCAHVMACAGPAGLARN
jgi:hypothetical protein